MIRTSTSLSPANGRSGRTERKYSSCPLCRSRRFGLGVEKIPLTIRGKNGIELLLRRWACERCGERILTDASRRKIDSAYGLAH